MAILDYAAAAATKSQLKRGKTADQKLAIDYLIPKTGLMGMIFGKKDEEYDAVLKTLIDSCGSYQRAINKIGLDEDELKEIPPVTLYGYEHDKAQLARVGKDGLYRSNLYSITHLFFSSTQVYMYQIILDTISSSKKERTEEYFYKDITNFSTSTDSEEVTFYKGCTGTPTKGTVEIQRFGLIVPGDKFTCGTYGDIEQQVRAMKNKLREKKL